MPKLLMVSGWFLLAGVVASTGGIGVLAAAGMVIAALVIAN